MYIDSGLPTISGTTMVYPNNYSNGYFTIDGSGGSSSYKHNKPSSEDYLASIAFFYKSLFDVYLKLYPDETDKYNTLLRLYNGDYKKTVIAIEIELQRKASESFTVVTGE